MICTAKLSEALVGLTRKLKASGSGVTSEGLLVVDGNECVVNLVGGL